MKKLLFSLLMLVGSIALNAQMTVSVTGNTVKFSAPIPGTDWNDAPVNLYAYVEAADNTANLVREIFGAFGGTAMVNNGSGVYSVSANLANFFPAGTTVNDIKFIYTSVNPGGGFYQNPGTGGFSVNDAAHATGYTPVTISVLAVNDLENAKKTAVVANGKLFTAQTGNLDIAVYDMSGKLISTSQVKANGSAIDLNVTQKGTYFVKVTANNQTETVKFVN